MILTAKVALFTIVVPASVAFYLPYAMTGGTLVPKMLAARLPWCPAWLLLAAGLSVYLKCAWDFARGGGGTPAPLDPPKRLLVKGLYRYTRNPMYWGILSMSALVGGYALSVLAGFHLFVTLYEEPALSRQFGAAYKRYRDNVPRWGLRLRPYNEAN